MRYTSKELLHRTPGGKIRTWQISAEDGCYITITGDYNSHKTVSAPTRCHPKNVGRSNELDKYASAVSTAKSMFKAKLDEGYCLSLEDLELQDKIPRAMLAKSSLEKEMKKVQPFLDRGHVYVQPKLDGFRCLADRTGLWTRDLRRITTVPHIWKVLEPVFQEHPDLVIDGELYSHSLNSDFGKIQSLLTKEVTGLFDAMEVEELIAYHVYDFVSKKPFRARLVHGRTLLPDHPKIVRVKTLKVDDLEHINQLHARFRKDGYEGTMVRVSSKEYEQNKRAGQLIKVKDFYDEEVTVVSVHEGNGQWTGAVKSITCMDSKGRTFDAGCSGKYEFLSSVLLNKNSYIGGKATIQYFDKFKSGIPRFPVATKFYMKEEVDEVECD